MTNLDSKLDYAGQSMPQAKRKWRVDPQLVLLLVLLLQLPAFAALSQAIGKPWRERVGYVHVAVAAALGAILLVTGVRTVCRRVGKSWGLAIRTLVFTALGVSLSAAFVVGGVQHYQDKAKLARDKAVCQACEQHLRQLGMWLREYSAAHNGKCPASIVEIVQDRMERRRSVDLSVLVCPGDAGAPVKTNGSAGSIGTMYSSYRFCANGVPGGSCSDGIVLYENIANHATLHRLNIVYANGTTDALQHDNVPLFWQKHTQAYGQGTGSKP